MSGRGGRVALVTGGGRRIGEAISRRLSREGYLVFLTYRVARREARALAAEIGGKALRLDLARPEGFSRVAGMLAREHGRLDLLVHSAAVFPRAPLGSISPRDWDDVFDVNLRGPFLLTQRLLPLLRRAYGGGAVLFLGDAGARRLWPGYLPYCFSKLALEGQARAWKKLLSPGVRVGIVRPGLALIPEGFPEKTWKALRSREGPGRLDSPEKVAGAVLRFALGGRYNFPHSP
jgi:pteridine reductase